MVKKRIQWENLAMVPRASKPRIEHSRPIWQIRIVTSLLWRRDYYKLDGPAILECLWASLQGTRMEQGWVLQKTSRWGTLYARRTWRLQIFARDWMIRIEW